MHTDPYFKSLVDSLPDMIWAFDNHFKLTVANTAFLDMRFDLYHQNLQIGDNIFKYVPESVVEKWKPIYQKVLNGERIIKDDIRLINRAPVSVRLILTPVKQENEIIGCMGITIDSTREANLELELELLQKKYMALTATGNHQLITSMQKFVALSEQFMHNENLTVEDEQTLTFMLNEELMLIKSSLDRLHKQLNDK